MNKKVEQVLVLSPRMHDGEFSAGGTITRFAEEGKQIFYVIFSTIDTMELKTYSKELLKEECLRAKKKLGIPEDNVVFLDFNKRVFPKQRQEILDSIITIGRDIRPDLVICPSSFDTYQDHQVIYNEAFRAFKKTSSIWGMEQPWSTNSRTDIFIKLTLEHVNKKVCALNEYKSQYSRDHFSEEFIKASAYTRGMTIGVEYAEGFECIRNFHRLQ